MAALADGGGSGLPLCLQHNRSQVRFSPCWYLQRLGLELVSRCMREGTGTQWHRVHIAEPACREPHVRGA